MSARGGVAVLIVLAWLAGLGLLVRREYFQGEGQRLETAAMFVQPSASFYRVEQGGTQIGFASSTLDTSRTEISVIDYFIADLPVEGKLHRATVNSTVRLSRGLRLRDFKVAIGSDAGPIIASGRVEGDSILVFALDTRAPGASAADTDAEPADTQRVRTNGPILLPTIVPLAVALGERPKVGRKFTVELFDPVSMTPKTLSLVARAESLFVVSDSAAFDATQRRWIPALRDTVRAWRIEAEAGNGFSGWVDAQGRLVEASRAGLVLRRMAYELAYENWRLDDRDLAARRTVVADTDIQETTAIAASIPIARRRLGELRTRLTNVDLAGYDLAGARQTLRGDTLIVTREPESALLASYTLTAGAAAMRARFPQELAPEPLLQTRHPKIVALARRLAAGETDPRAVAERINAWVHDSLEKRITIGLPNALQVLQSRAGDCNEHTQLFVALARAAGIPARSAAGLAYVGGKFYYHAWPEVYLGTWVAVDPTFGQFPADAAHLRFIIGGLARQADLLRLIGNLKIDVVSSR